MQNLITDRNPPTAMRCYLTDRLPVGEGDRGAVVGVPFSPLFCVCVDNGASVW